MTDTRTRIIEAIRGMRETGESITIHAVAARCGVSHSLIYNRYPDLKEKIKELKTTQKQQRKAEDDQALIARLTSEKNALHAKVKRGKEAMTKDSFKALLTHVQEVYSMYDGLLEERNRLAGKLASGK
ncbi:TetR/AcrR family transcriptional regulator [Paraburkholderia bengalensis]|uniref:TetR/AcrR family transcriptional regulator n=1 Tax=Paraburkholderia bengalensis TaxID=2747562 RepID=A0ABU8J3B0_9BURK